MTEKHAALIEAIAQKTPDELAQLANDLRAAFNIVPPKGLFSSVEYAEPSLYYDCGMTYLVAICDPGDNMFAFVKLMRTHTDADLSHMSDLYRRVRSKHDVAIYRMEHEKAEAFMDDLKDIGAVCRFDIDDIAEMRRTKCAALPRLTEERLYRAAESVLTEKGARCTVYEYRIRHHRDETLPDAFVPCDSRVMDDGRLNTRVYTLLSWSEMLRLQILEDAQYSYEFSGMYHITL